MYNEEEYNDGEEDQIINEEYKIWKKNTPYLYDFVLTTALEWPSLTINWLPISEKGNYLVQKFVVGTHTNGEANSLMIMKVRMPQVSENSSDVKENNIGGNSMNSYAKLENKIEVETRINHQGEVNKARHMPQKYNIIATKTPSGEVHIFDYFKHPPKPSDATVKPDLRLQGHNKEGYGLNWSTRREGYLLSGSDDHRVCFWDLNSNSLNPTKTMDDHKGVVEDVNWHKQQENIFASCGDDRKLMLWDLKQDKPIHITEAHSQEVNSVEFNYFNDFQLLTASNDKTVALWDMRNMNVKVHTFDHHKGDVLAARWNPHFEGLFASFSSDRRVDVWDIQKIGTMQSVADQEDGPSELLFTHGGHTAKISDLDWNPHQKLMCASVAEDNILHIWEMANDIYYCDGSDSDRMIEG